MPAYHQDCGDQRTEQRYGRLQHTAAVDADTHLIVSHDVTRQDHDRDLPVPMALVAQYALHREELHVLADKG